MSEQRKSMHGLWSSRLAFILAATGAAVGLGNIWKFPYVTGQNGGGAFVLIYMLCTILIGIPLMMAEITLGRCGRQNPANTMRSLATESGLKPNWQWVGAITIICGPLILSYYSVIAGWAMSYAFKALSNQFSQISANDAQQMFNTLVNSPWQLFFWHTVIISSTAWVVSRGLEKGIEKTVFFMFPMMLLLLIILVFYGIHTGYFHQALVYLFEPDFSAVSSHTILVALGQAFFSLSLATGPIMMYGAYLPHNTSITSSAVIITLADTGIALLAGIAIFPIVFANHLEPSAGPGLIFQTLPIAFGHMPYGTLFASLFFIMLVFAAFTSTISLVEPSVAWLIENKQFSRRQAAVFVGTAIWIAGIGTILSFSYWSDFKLFGKNIFESVDYLTANILMPLGGLLIAIFTVWRLKRDFIRKELKVEDKLLFRSWYFTMRYLVPCAIVLIFLSRLN